MVTELSPRIFRDQHGQESSFRSFAARKTPGEDSPTGERKGTMFRPAGLSRAESRSPGPL